MEEVEEGVGRRQDAVLVQILPPNAGPVQLEKKKCYNRAFNSHKKMICFDLIFRVHVVGTSSLLNKKQKHFLEIIE
jgi:hypothetical protein